MIKGEGVIVNKRLMLEAGIKYMISVTIAGLLIFLPAGDLGYVQGWIFMALVFIPMLVIFIILLRKNPELLKRRLRVFKNNKSDKIYIFLSLAILISGFIIAGLDYRYKWAMVPTVLTLIGTCLFIIGYILYTSISKEYLDFYAQIERHDTKFVNTGLYSLVRHPMYGVTLLIYVSIPLILASVISLAVFMLYPIVIVIRIHNEEKVLIQNDEYKKYMKEVKYRLIPFIW